MLNEHAVRGVVPDLTFIIDLNVDDSLKRSKLRLKQQNMFEEEGRFESENLEFHRRVRRGFLQIARSEPERIVLLDGGKSVLDLNRSIQEHVLKLLRTKYRDRIVAKND